MYDPAVAVEGFSMLQQLESKPAGHEDPDITRGRLSVGSGN
jgi:hypothetical protein